MKKNLILPLFLLFSISLNSQITYIKTSIDTFTFTGKNDTSYYNMVVTDIDINSYDYADVKYFKARRYNDNIEILVRKRKTNNHIIKEDIEYQKKLSQNIEDIHNGQNNIINVEKESIFELKWITFDPKKYKIIYYE